MRKRDEQQPPIHPAESCGATSATRAAAPVAALVAKQVLRDGEIVQLILKPSLWYILLSSLPFLAAVGLLLVFGFVREERYWIWYLQASVFLGGGRLVLAILQWMGRMYILTDLRIVRLSGIFTVDVFDCPLRRVSGVRRTATIRERLLRLGSIEIAPQDQSCPPGVWQTVAKPRDVHEKILAAISRAQHGNGER